MNEKIDISLADVSVIIGMPIHRGVPGPTFVSTLNTVAACYSKGIPIDVISTNGSSVVMTARNQIAHAFLKTDGTHLFWIDSDIWWTVENFLRVLAMSTRYDTARALYPRRQERVFFDQDGLGFACVQRKVIERMTGAAPMMHFGEAEPCAAIFTESFAITDKARAHGATYEYRAEDSTFFAQAERYGFTTWIDPHETVGHVGEKIFRAELREHQWEIKDGTADRSREQPRQADSDQGEGGVDGPDDA